MVRGAGRVDLKVEVRVYRAEGAEGQVNQTDSFSK